MPEVIFNGADGRLEGRYHHDPRANAPLALILHPHPLHGGTMNNKVVYDLFHMFVRRGFSALRFNFRGVGRSQESFDHGQGELRDAAAALDWMQQHNPNSSGCWVAGFSFGAWIGMQLLMRRPEIHGFLSVGAARQHVRLQLPGALPVLRPDRAWRRRRAGAAGLGRQAGPEAVAAARHQDRPRGDPGRRPLLQRPPAASSARAIERYLDRSLRPAPESALAQAGR